MKPGPHEHAPGEVCKRCADMDRLGALLGAVENDVEPETLLTFCLLTAANIAARVGEPIGVEDLRAGFLKEARDAFEIALAEPLGETEADA